MRNLKLRYNGELKSTGTIDADHKALLVRSIDGRVHLFYISANRLNLLSDYGDHRTLVEESTDLHDTLQIADSFNSIILLLPANNVLRITNALSETDLSVTREKIEPSEDCTAHFEVSKIIFNPNADKAILLTTTPGLVFVATGYLQPLYKIDLYDEQKITRPSVGWGQKATQFKGYRKKNQSIDEANNDAMRCTTSDESCSDVASYVCWRSDGTLFAINYYHRDATNHGERKIKIFTEEAALKYVSEQNNALEGPISWKPSNGFIGAVQLIGENSRQICLLEQNALYHCSFQLPGSFRVNELCWNERSDVLATSVENEREEYRILLWVSSNCNWYLKQSVPVNGKVHRMVWDSFKPYRLHLLTRNGYAYYEWTFKYDVSLPFSRCDYGVLIATINGSCCELSCPTESGLIPPPMCAFRVDLPHSLDAIVFPQCADEFDCMSFIAVMKNELALCVKENAAFTNKTTYRLNNDADVDVLSHWFWRSPSVLYFQCTSDGHGESVGRVFLCRVRLENRNEADRLLTVSRIRLPAAISSVASFNNDGLLINLVNGNVFVLSVSSGDEFGDSSMIAVPKTNFHYDRIELTESGVIGISVDDDENTNTNTNYNDRRQQRSALVVADKIRVAENVSDFFWTSPYLLYTTNDVSTLVCCRFDDSFCAPSSPLVRLMDRKLEAGCRLVTVIGCTVVLQHPRGNLESIVPRPFVLSYLHWMLGLKRYSEAFYFLRRMRVTYNMLFDHDPEAFQRNVELFLTQLSDRNGNDRLKAFVGELDSKCYAVDLYRDYYYRRAGKKNASRPDKLSTILDSLVTTMLRSPGEEEYAELIITCLAKRGNLQRALQFSKERNLVSYLLKLVSGRNLFQAALSCYDMDLALTIAKMAQLDPKQYREQLDRLSAMSENRRQFSINEMAGNFEEALRCLIVADDDGDADSPTYLQFIEQRNLYLSGLKLTDRMSDKHPKVCLLYANHLFRTRSYGEAAAFYECLGRYSEASRCYLEAGRWDECLSLLPNDAEPDKMSLVDEIVRRCCVDRNFTKAAEVTYRYRNDVRKSIDLYLNGYEYDRALNLALSVRRSDLTQTIRSAVMANSYPHLWKSIARFVDSIAKHSNRLKTIKESKLTIALQDELDDDFDVYSREPSLVGSGRSSSGTVSSRTTEKRLWNLKEGNPREEIALYKQVRSDLDALYRLTEETGTLCRVLVRLNEISRASKLQKHLKNALTVAETVKSIVWSCSTADRLRRYDDVFVRCLPVDVYSNKCWEVPFLNDF